jgi:hypothetical protein
MSPAALRRLSGCLVVAGILAGCGEAPWPDLEVRQYRQTLRLAGDGSVAVEETLVFPDRPTQVVEYPLPSTWLDGVADVAVFVDGGALVEGQGPGSFEVEPEPGGRVNWRPSSDAFSGREVTLTYRAIGVMAVSGARGQFRWRVVPRVSGPVGSAEVLLVLPDDAIPVEGPVVDVVGWDVTRGPGGFALSKTTVAATEGGVVWVDLVLGDLSTPEPRWQYNAARGRELMPAFVAAGLFLVVIGLGSLWMIRFQYPPVRVTSELSDGAPAVERELAAALAGPASLRRCSRAEIAALTAAGLVDPERLVVGRGLRTAGIVLLVVGTLSVPVVDVLLGHFGGWPQALPAGILLVSVLFGVAGWRFPVLTEAGCRVARASTGEAENRAENA